MGMLDAITEQEIREYEEYCKQQEEEFIENCRMSQEYYDRVEVEEWQDLMDNADYYND